MEKGNTTKMLCQASMQQMERKWHRWTDVSRDYPIPGMPRGRGQGVLAFVGSILDYARTPHYLPVSQICTPLCPGKGTEAKSGCHPSSPNTYLTETPASLTRIYSVLKGTWPRA